MSEIYRTTDGVGGREDAERAITSLLAVFGIDSETAEMRDTAARVAASYAELFRGVNEDPHAPLLRGSPVPEGTLFVALREIEFRSVCAHHLLPFSGVASVVYAPGDRVVGIGSIVRMIDTLSTRPQLQETLGCEIATSLVEGARAEGAAVVLTARHSCVADRGPREASSTMRTVAVVGSLARDDLRREALAALGAYWM